MLTYSQLKTLKILSVVVALLLPALAEGKSLEPRLPDESKVDYSRPVTVLALDPAVAIRMYPVQHNDLFAAYRIRTMQDKQGREHKFRKFLGLYRADEIQQTTFSLKVWERYPVRRNLHQDDVFYPVKLLALQDNARTVSTWYGRADEGGSYNPEYDLATLTGNGEYVGAGTVRRGEIEAAYTVVFKDVDTGARLGFGVLAADDRDAEYFRTIPYTSVYAGVDSGDFSLKPGLLVGHDGSRARFGAGLRARIGFLDLSNLQSALWFIAGRGLNFDLRGQLSPGRSRLGVVMITEYHNLPRLDSGSLRWSAGPRVRVGDKSWLEATAGISLNGKKSGATAGFQISHLFHGPEETVYRRKQW